MEVTKVEHLTDGSSIVSMKVDTDNITIVGNILIDVDNNVVDHFLTGRNMPMTRQLTTNIALGYLEDNA